MIMTDSLPYVNGYNQIENLLLKMKEVPIPEVFSHDFIKNKLMLRSSTYHAMVPLLKKLEFLDASSKPTTVYKEWKDSSRSQIVMAQSLKKAYSRLYEYSEFLQNLSDNEIKEKIAVALNIKAGDEKVKNIFGTFNILRNHANFDDAIAMPTVPKGQELVFTKEPENISKNDTKLGISYTINLHLPPSDDKAVFDAIFTSLKKHLL